MSLLATQSYTRAAADDVTLHHLLAISLACKLVDKLSVTPGVYVRLDSKSLQVSRNRIKVLLLVPTASAAAEFSISFTDSSDVSFKWRNIDNTDRTRLNRMSVKDDAFAECFKLIIDK